MCLGLKEELLPYWRVKKVLRCRFSSSFSMENCLIANFLFLMDFFQVMILADRLYLILVACKNTSFTFSPITPHNEEWFPANIHEPIPCSAESLLPKMNLTTSRSLVFQGDCSVVFSDLLSSCLCV